MDQHTKLIEKYIAGELTEKELALLHESMVINPELKKEIDLVVTIQQALTTRQATQQKEQQLKETLTTLNKQYFPDTSPKKKSTIRTIAPWLAAASLLLLITISLLIGRQNYAIQNLVADNYEPISLQNRGTINIPSKVELDNSDPNYLYNLYQLTEPFHNNQQFDQLQEAYATLLANQQNPTYNRQDINFELVAWNYLLIQMRRNDATTTEQLAALLRSDISKKYKNKAIRLQQKRNHFFYQLFN